jgi:Xaa-Pro aminopeptidase
MLTPHPTLLIGPSDWDAERMPRAEFARRIDALWAHAPQAERAVIYGNSRHHAELAYLTNLVPKLGPAVALLSRTGPHRMFVGDAANMLGAARPLTWIEDVASMKEAAAAIADGEAGRRLLLIGADYMPLALRGSITEALGQAASVADATAQVWSQMRRKSRYELDAIDAAVKATGVARNAMREALTSGAGVTDVVLAGECAASAAGAQDVRTLFSLDGGRTLRPFDGPIKQQVDPLLAYLTIRRFNYWAECFPLFTKQRESTRLYEKVWDAMLSARPAIRAGVATHEIAQLIAAAIEPHQAHPVIGQALVQRMGLALDEPSNADVGAAFEEGEVYSLRVGAVDEAGGSMICSRMFVVQADGILAFDDGI